MSKRAATASLAALALGIGGLWTAAVATADGHEPPPIPPHAHMLLLGASVEIGPGGVPEHIDYRKCIDLAHNQTLRLNAHHQHLHFGRAGVAQRTAGHLIVPTAPAFGLPWSGCAEFATFFAPS